MSWARRPALVSLLLAALVAGCGFQPLYDRSAPGSPTTATALQGIVIAPIAERSGQILRNYLIDATGSNGSGVPTRYTLTVTLAEATSDLALLPDGTTTYARYTATSNYVLRDAASGAVALQGALTASNSYNALASGYATIIAREDARERALRQLSTDMVTRLALFVDRK